MMKIENLRDIECFVFDMDGNYRKTLDVGYKIQDYCIDEDNSRVIFVFSDEIQFGYLNIEKLI